MVADAVGLLRTATVFAVQQTDRLFSAIDGYGIILYTFIVYSTYRFFLKPLLGGAGSSDFAQRRFIGKGGASNNSASSSSKDLSV